MNREVIENYFISWKNYDLKLLSNIFEVESTYSIINKSFCYKGINEITNYWIRNSKRQKDLDLKWEITKENKKVTTVTFNANFYDIEEKEYNNINGCINFYINKNKKIYKLSETYNKKVNI